MMCSNLIKLQGFAVDLLNIASEGENEDRKARLFSLADEIILIIEKMSDEADCED